MENIEKELREQLNKVSEEKRQLEYITSTLLGCGNMDLSMLYSIEYDLSDILDYLEDIGAIIGLNELLEGAIELFRRNIQNKIDDIKEEYHNLRGELGDSRDKDDLKFKKEYDLALEDLEKIDIYEDTSYYVNYIDSSIEWDCSDELKDIYKKYLNEVIDNENNMLGFTYLDI